MLKIYVIQNAHLVIYAVYLVTWVLSLVPLKYIISFSDLAKNLDQNLFMCWGGPVKVQA